MKEILYNGPELTIRNDGIRIKKKKLVLSYQEISSIRIKRARLSRFWLLYILSGILLNAFIIFLIYRFLMNFYLMADSQNGHFHYARRSQGMIIGILVLIPIGITMWMTKYFKKSNMLIIRWNRSEYRIKTDDLHITLSELKRYLEGKFGSVQAGNELKG